MNNSGIIRATAPVGLTSHAAIEALDLAGASSVSNTGNGTTTGVISAGRFGIVGAKGDVTNNGGLIEATGTIGIAVSLTDATVSNNVNGSSIGRIFGTLFGIGATNANVTNSGVIGIGNTGTSDTAIHANGTATVSNTGDGTTTGIIREPRSASTPERSTSSPTPEGLRRLEQTPSRLTRQLTPP